jgi:5,5'-dehydrodivanillate O-demethylase
MLTAKENERLMRVGPGTPMGELMRRYWHPVAAVAELDENPVKAVKILGESLVVYRDRKGGYGLIDDTCPHRRISLEYGIPENEGLRCPYHGWLFDGSGQCLEMPAESPESTFPSRVKIKGYPAEELGGLVFAYLGPAPAPLLPRWDLYVMDNVVRDIGSTVIPCNWMQCMENSLDPTHTEWLHGHYYNYVMEQKGAEGLTDPTYRRFVPRVIGSHEKIGFDVFEHGIVKRRIRAGFDESHPMWRIGHPIVFPNVLRVGTTFQIRVPMDDTHTWHLMYGAYPNPPGEPGYRQEKIPFYQIPLKDSGARFVTDFVLGQDMMAWATQGELADRGQEKLGESDKGIILYRRLLREQMALVEDGGEPMNTFRDPEQNEIIHLFQERTMEDAARARGLSTGQAPYSPLIPEIEEAWANAAEPGD